MTNYVKRFELFTTAQEERVKTMRSTVPEWMDSLQTGEQLLIGLPEVLGNWKEAIPLVVFKHMKADFLAWLEESESYVAGPVYNLPALTAGFICVVIDENFDEANYEPPEDASEELLATLQSLASFLRSQVAPQASQVSVAA